MVQHYFFSNLLVFSINFLIFGTTLSYLLYFFLYKNQYQNIVKHDSIYNILKLLLLLVLGVSFVFFILFFYFYYTFYTQLNNYHIFNTYSISPKIYLYLLPITFEFSVDLFGIILLFLSYFVGILSLMALDNRIF